MNFEAPQIEQEEVTIDSVEGLTSLLEYATDTLEEVRLLASDEDSPERVASIASAEAAFTNLQQLIEQHARVLSLGGFLSDVDAAEIQTLYNQIVSVLDGLTLESSSSATVAVEEATNLSPVSPVEVPLEGEEDSAQQEPLKEPFFFTLKEAVHDHVLDEAEEDDRPVVTSGSLYLRNESNPETAIQIRETTLDSESMRRQLKELAAKAAPLVERAERMHKEYEALTTVPHDDDDFKNGVFLYQQLDQSLHNAKEILTDCTTWQATPTKDGVELFLLHATQELDEFATNIDSIDQGLLWFFHEPEHEKNEALDSGSERSVSPESKRMVDAEKLFRPAQFATEGLRSYIDTVITEPTYKRFLSARFASPSEFEAHLQREIASREAPSKLDKVLGITHKSPFSTLLRDKTVAEVELFDAQPSEVIRASLQEAEVQYETYVLWLHDFAVMKQLVHPRPAMTFGELFVRAITEDLITLEEMST